MKIMTSVLNFRTNYPVGKEPYDEVLLAPVGEGHLKSQVWQRVHHLDPDRVPEHKRAGQSYDEMLMIWSVVQPAWEAYKNKQEIPENGTPLAAWSGVSPEQASALASMGIKTVESVRDMGDGAVSNLRFPGARKLPELAAKWLEGKDIASRDAENAELRERLAAMEELLNERMDDKPKRGRPRKEAEAA